jgi:mannosyltransferase
MIKLKNERIYWLALALAVLAGIASLVIGLRQGLWFDEAYSVLLAQHSWGEIVRLTAQDVHPPVYYWLLKAWMAVFGSSELALRSLSALMFGLAIGVAALLMRRAFGARVALLALPFVAFAPFLLRYGFEIRMYSFASLIGITATYVLIVALEAKTRRARWLLYGLYAFFVILGLYTLYYMALIWISHFVWVIWQAYKSRQPKSVLPVLTAYIVGAVAFLPWLPVFLGKATGDTLSPVTHPLGVNNLIGIASFSFLYRAWWQLGAVWALALVFAVSAVAYLAYQGFKTASPMQRQYLILLGLYMIVPVLILIPVTHYRPVYIERYLAHLLIGGYAFMGIVAALATMRKGRRNLVISGAIVCILLIGCLQLAGMGNYNFQRLQKPSVKQIAGLMTDCRDGSVIFANDPQVAIELSYYIKDCPIRFYNETPDMTGGYAMLSNSPLRVGDPAGDLKGVQKLYYIYYDKPRHAMPDSLHKANVTTIESLNVATYVSGRRFAG